MIRGIDGGVRRTVTAKLRECGLDEERAKHVAESQHQIAVEFFKSELGKRQLKGVGLERALDDSFAALSQWAVGLAAT